MAPAARPTNRMLASGAICRGLRRRAGDLAGLSAAAWISAVGSVRNDPEATVVLLEEILIERGACGAGAGPAGAGAVAGEGDTGAPATGEAAAGTPGAAGAAGTSSAAVAASARTVPVPITSSAPSSRKLTR